MWINIKTLFVIIYRFIAETIICTAIVFPMVAYVVGSYYLIKMLDPADVALWLLTLLGLTSIGIFCSVWLYVCTWSKFNHHRWWYYFKFIPDYFINVRSEIVYTEELKEKQKQQKGEITEI